MIEIIVGIVLVVIGSLILTPQIKGERLSASRMAAAIGTIVIIVGAVVVLSFAGPEPGLPTTKLSQNTPFYVKSIRVEGGTDVYMELVPYNDINATKQYYYKVPAEKFQQLANITAGTVIINDNGVIRPFPTT